jgi:hypothetical protein
VASKIQVRRDTVANWNSVAGSVILAAGEIGYETDTRNLKIGDGTSVWSALKYQAPVYSGTNSTLAAATLAVDQTNNRVGIGTASPSAKIQVTDNNPTRGIVGLVTNSGTSSLTGAQIQITQNTIQDYVIGQPAGVDALAIWRGRNTGADGTERMRISSTGNVGIGTAAPLDQLHIEGATPIIRLKDTTSTTAEYAQIDASNSTGSILIAADPGNTTASTTAAISVDGTTRISAGTAGVAITGTLSTSALYTANAGITVPTGQTVTIASGATLSVVGTLALPAGSVEIADLQTIATLSVLGNSSGSTAAVQVLTAGVSGTARTALGLPVIAYTPRIYNNALAALQNITLKNTGPDTITIDITSNTIDVEYWYKYTTLITTSGTNKRCSFAITCPAGSSFLFERIGATGEGTNWTSAATADPIPQASGTAVVVFEINNGSSSTLTATSGWISVRRITAV